MQNTFSQSGNDSKWFSKKSFFRIGMWNSRPPFMEKNILNFHFDYLIIRLIWLHKHHLWRWVKDQILQATSINQLPLVFNWRNKRGKVPVTSLMWQLIVRRLNFYFSRLPPLPPKSVTPYFLIFLICKHSNSQFIDFKQPWI